MVLGASALFAMGIGMGIPLILIGVTAGKWLPRRGPWMKVVQNIFGILMVGMALWLLARISSTTIISVFCGVLLLAVALYVGIYLARSGARQKFNRRLGIAAGMTGLFIIVAGTGASSMMNSFLQVNRPAAVNVFTIVHSVADLQQRLALAQASHKPVLLDFYADWCESCVVMDKNVFNLPDVQNKLSKFVLLRADLSAYNTADETLLKNYEVIAPPTVIFFNDSGQEVNSHRIVGELNAIDFMTRINTFITASCDTKVAC
jgi:thioredoxin:protein disulfide reductase